METEERLGRSEAQERLIVSYSGGRYAAIASLQPPCPHLNHKAYNQHDAKSSQALIRQFLPLLGVAVRLVVVVEHVAALYNVLLVPLLLEVLSLVEYTKNTVGAVLLVVVVCDEVIFTLLYFSTPVRTVVEVVNSIACCAIILG